MGRDTSRLGGYLLADAIEILCGCVCVWPREASKECVVGGGVRRRSDEGGDDDVLSFERFDGLIW
jgi:hypothetical protein